MMNKRFQPALPTIAELAEILICVSAEVIEPDPDDYPDGSDLGEAFIDVRLRYFDGTWALHTGSSDYDTDHRGAWGASSVPADLDQSSAESIAYELLEQVWEGISYRVTFSAHCGMITIDEGDLSLVDARSMAARVLRRRRKSGHLITGGPDDHSWDVGEPEDCCMVPDTAGILSVSEDH